MVESPRIVSPDIEEPVLVNVVDRRRMRRHEHPKRLVQEITDVWALVEDHRRVVTGEEHGRCLDLVGRQVENPEVAEDVARDRESGGENLGSTKGQAPPREIDRV
jgi:hypothetical protein